MRSLVAQTFKLYLHLANDAFQNIRETAMSARTEEVQDSYKQHSAHFPMLSRRFRRILPLYTRLHCTGYITVAPPRFDLLR